MKRLVEGAGALLLLLAVLYLLPGFALSSFSQQTARARWETWHQGAAYTTPVTEQENFSNCFIANGYSSVGGSAYWRGDGFRCSWAVDGVGVGNVAIDIHHEDGGLDCTCVVGSCTAGPNVELPCACASAFQMLPGSTYCMQVDAGSTCGTTEPGQFHCTMDLFR